MNTNQQHNDFIMLFRFQYPDETLKSWVVSDINNVGSYHEDYNVLIPLIEKIESLSNLNYVLNFKIKNGIVEVTVYDSIMIPLLYKYKYQDLYLVNKRTKIQAIHLAAIKFVKWFNSSENNVLDYEQDFISPYSKRLIKKMKNTTFSDMSSICELKTYVSGIFGCTVEDIEGASRKRDIVKARQMVLATLVIDGYTLDFAGSTVNKDHTTSYHSKNEILNMIDTKDGLYYGKIMMVIDHYDLYKKFKIEK